MSLVPVEMLEEDAADLQFPKDVSDNKLQSFTGKQLLDKTQDYENHLTDVIDAFWDETDTEFHMEQMLAYLINSMKNEFTNDENLFIDSKDLLAKLCIVQNENNTTYFSTENKNEIEIILNYISLMLNKSNITDMEITILINLIHTVITLKIDENCRQSFFQHLWNVTITDFNRKSSKLIQEKLLEVFPIILIDTIEKLIKDNCNVQQQLDETLLKCNNEYLALIKWCTLSKSYFQQLCKEIAKLMLNNSFQSNDHQLFLNFILNEIKANMKISTFYNFYDDDLINYILIINNNNNNNNRIEKMLEVVKSENFINFIILITHFPNYLYMLERINMFNC